MKQNPSDFSSNSTSKNQTLFSPTDNKDNLSDKVRNMDLETNKNNADSKNQNAEQQTVKFPQNFEVKYLGRREAGGLWGIKHTRRPVDEMVNSAKDLKPGQTLPFLRLTITDKGVEVGEMAKNLNKDFHGGFYPIEVISYGVQDLVYTRVFAMIVVKEDAVTNTHPFHCHAFVCDSRQNARQLTFALAQAFQQFSREVKGKLKKPKKFAIDLRPPEEKEADMEEIADSEA